MKTVGATRQRTEDETLTHDPLFITTQATRRVPASRSSLSLLCAMHHASAAPDEELLTSDAGSVPMSRATKVNTMTN